MINVRKLIFYYIRFHILSRKFDDSIREIALLLFHLLNYFESHFNNINGRHENTI